jgi:hypothetical protein
MYGEKGVTVRYLTIDLLWRPVGHPIRFVAVKHPTRGNITLMSTDLALEPVEIIRLYSLRFKIEVGFKQALHTIGAYAYHFWLKAMKPIKRCSGGQYLHRESEKYRHAVRRKLGAYHAHIQIGIIAQGMLQYLSVTASIAVWKNFGSWIRTIRPGILPSEQVAASALKNSLPDFLKVSGETQILAKFIADRFDLSQAEGIRLAG